MSLSAGLRVEIGRLARSRLDLALLTLLPAVLLASMAAMIFPGSLHSLKVVVVDRDGGTLARAIVRDLHAGERAARMLSLMAMVLGIAPIIAGFVGQNYGIGNILWMPLVGVILGIVVCVFLTETAPKKVGALASAH